MAKQRVYELARDLGLESKDVLARAQELGIEVKTASSGLDEDATALVRLSYEETAAESPGAAKPRSRTRSRGRCRSVRRAGHGTGD